MPRKQNGFGKFDVSGVRGVNKQVNKGRGTKAFGTYPSVRSFGSTYTRSVIEQYDYESTWTRWRRGFEYYTQGAYLDFGETEAVIYQGTDFEVPVTFKGNRFATKNADSKTHYAIHRSIDQNIGLGTVIERYNDEFEYPEYKRAREIWCKVTTLSDTGQALLPRAVGERVTDGQTAANISWVLTSDKKPAIYIGKAPPTGITAEMSIPLDEIENSQFVQNNGGDVQSLVGEVVYMPDFYRSRPTSLFDRFTDFDRYFTVELTEFVGGADLRILDTSEGLPPTLGDINDYPTIYKTTKCSGGLQGQFIFEKERYQRFFGQRYLTAEVVQQEVDSLAYGILPWTILSVRKDVANNALLIKSEPFQTTLQLFTPPEPDRFIIFDEKSFTIQTADYDDDGNYNHKPEPIPGEQIWQKINLSVDPWMDEIFAIRRELSYADLYTCSCPAYLHAMLRSPEFYDEDGRTINRQYRAPMPTAKGASSYDAAGIAKTAGIAQSWATAAYKKSFKICKHTVASMFIDKIRVMEPNTFPSADAREAFDKKIAEDVNEVAAEFISQLRRSEITQVEIIYALAEALNLDDIEIGYVLLTARF